MIVGFAVMNRLCNLSGRVFFSARVGGVVVGRAGAVLRRTTTATYARFLCTRGNKIVLEWDMIGYCRSSTSKSNTEVLDRIGWNTLVHEEVTKD